MDEQYEVSRAEKGPTGKGDIVEIRAEQVSLVFFPIGAKVCWCLSVEKMDTSCGRREIRSEKDGASMYLISANIQK